MATVSAATVALGCRNSMCLAGSCSAVDAELFGQRQHKPRLVVAEVRCGSCCGFCLQVQASDCEICFHSFWC